MLLRAVKQIIEPKPTIEAAGVKLQRLRSARPGKSGRQRSVSGNQGRRLRDLDR